MSAAQNGDKVKVHYTGKLPDGTVFDSSSGREPLEFTIGEQRVIPGFEEAVVGMTPGDAKTATISPEKGYGERRDELVLEFERTRIPADIDTQVGAGVQLQSSTGQPIPAVVVESGEATVKVDANHPLAGQDLTFDIELVEIVAAS